MDYFLVIEFVAVKYPYSRFIQKKKKWKINFVGFPYSFLNFSFFCFVVSWICPASSNYKFISKKQTLNEFDGINLSDEKRILDGEIHDTNI